MSVYITGDTHGDIHEFHARISPCNLTEEDVLIIAGDFGFDWDNSAIISWLKLYHPYTVLFCDGNHENFDVLNRLRQEEHFGGPVGVFARNTFRLLSGHMYDIQGYKTFVFGGAASIDKTWRMDPENIAWLGKLWWKDEIPSRATYNLAKQTLQENKWTFDLFLTHTCPPDIKDIVLDGQALDFHDPVEHMIRRLESEIKKNHGKYDSHWFGHFHVDADVNNRHCLYKRILKIPGKGKTK